MIYFAFPHKMTSDGELKDGSLFPVPTFCKSHSDSKSCIKHYAELKKSTSDIVTCPYGFATAKLSIEGTEIILSCLNIEGITKRKDVLKLVKQNDFLPRLSQIQFRRLIDNAKEMFLENKTSNVRLLKLEESQEIVNNQKSLLENTLHEIRKINAQLKSSVESFSSEYSKDRLNFDRLNNLCTDIYSSANLLSIRFDTYDLEVNPDLNLNVVMSEIPIYKRIEKIYKCLNDKLRKRNLRLNLEGNSYKKFYSSNVIEIALFIVIENAIKYAMDNSDITIKFEEENTKLKVRFNNWGIRPDKSEIQHLSERGFRSSKVLNTKQYEGRGIGLYLFKKICETVDVSQKITIGTDYKAHNGYMFAPFIVEMTFKDMRD